MAGFLSIHRAKCLKIFLNICFLFLISCIATHLSSSKSCFLNQFRRSDSKSLIIKDGDIGCRGLHKFVNHQEKCSYVKTHKGCLFRGYISYLQLFYCVFSPLLGYTLLILWLILLFYLLGDTTANYFCSSLEGLSTTLNLSPTIAGVTLLSLGNGAPDMFTSIVSFMGDGTNDVGLNAILGGAFFVSSAVVGIISTSVCDRWRSIDKISFTRDVLFFLLSLTCLLVIISFGKINLWGALSYLSLYFIYVLFLCMKHKCINNDREEEEDRDGFCEAPLLIRIVEDKLISINDQVDLQVSGKNFKVLTIYHFFCKLLYILELPLCLPRRLTILDIREDRWSKPFAVLSVAIAPILLASIWGSISGNSSLFIYAIGALIGAIFGVLAFLTTEFSNPPRKFVLFWLLGGFLMSITWTYILAQELISLLVSVGLILGIYPSILGLTVLAWGNSLGDLVANLTMAKNGGPDGAQIAISACYAGPMFSTLVSLGLSLGFSAWSVYPSCFVIPRDPFVYETMGFLMGGLVWALVILPKRNMKLDMLFGCGLLIIYLCFLSLKMARTLV